MPTIDHHKKSFDSGTLFKLEIFESYAKEWIPVFLKSKFESVQIIDFFAGPGYDKSGIEGSPLRFIRQLNSYKSLIESSNTKIKLILNEKIKSKYDTLVPAVEHALSLYKLDDLMQLDIEITNLTFEKAYNKFSPAIDKIPSLVYLDQNGVKYTADPYFSDLCKTKRTDFIYFISSGHVNRLAKTKGFKKALNVDPTTIAETGYKYIHKTVVEGLKSKLPVGSKVKLYPYSIRKDNHSIHGIAFGASHPLAIEKFLRIAWNKDKITGDSNYQFRSSDSNQMPLFSDLAITSTKIHEFQKKVRALMLDGALKTNLDVKELCSENGMLSSHAKPVLETMKKEGSITFLDQSTEVNNPYVTYDYVYGKKKKIIRYIVKE